MGAVGRQPQRELPDGIATAKGLTRAAIAHSHTSFGRMATLREAEQNGSAFTKATGKATLAELRAMPADDVLKVFLANPGGLSGAIVDGWFLPTDIYTIYSQGKQNDVALLTGATNDEGGNLAVADDEAPAPGGAARGGGPPTTLAAYNAWAQRTLGLKAAEFLRLYPASNDAAARIAYHDATRDFNFAGHRTWAKLQSTTGKQRAFMYMFSHIPPVKEGNGNSPVPYRGAIHNTDMVYTFNNLRLWDYDWTETDRRVADSIGTYWTNFVKSLNPNGPGLPTWTTYDPANEMMLNINGNTRMERINSARMDLINAIEESNRLRR